MSLSVSNNTPKFFTQRTQEQKDADKKIIAGGGAIAGIKTFTNASKTTVTVTKKATGLWGKIGENMRWARDAVLNWKTKLVKIPFLKPILESKVYNRCASAFGYGLGLITLISGGADIVKVATDAANGNLFEK